MKFASKVATVSKVRKEPLLQLKMLGLLVGLAALFLERRRVMCIDHCRRARPLPTILTLLLLLLLLKQQLSFLCELKQLCLLKFLGVCSWES